MSESSSLPSATNRLEQNDASLTSIDLRGRGRMECSDAPVPRSKTRRFIAALKQFGRPLPSLRPSRPYQLEHLALHNHFLDHCELPLLFEALPFLTSLNTLVLFHHDLGDDGVDLLMRALTGKSSRTGEILGVGGSACIDAHAGSEVHPERNKDNTKQLQELYLSHCNISCKGASAIAKALDCSSTSSSTRGNKLKCLQVLSLGSNRISEHGALVLADAFGRYPSLQRMVLHGNKEISSSLKSSIHNDDVKLEKRAEKPIFYHALASAGLAQLTPTNLAMTIFAPLILPHIQSRWETNRVLVRPYELLRQRLRAEMYRKDSMFVDESLEFMPDVFSWMGRDGVCCRQTSLQSQTFSFQGYVMRHSKGCDQCRACATIHLNDLYELFIRVPHLVSLFQGISLSCIRCNEN